MVRRRTHLLGRHRSLGLIVTRSVGRPRRAIRASLYLKYEEHGEFVQNLRCGTLVQSTSCSFPRRNDWPVFTAADRRERARPARKAAVDSAIPNIANEIGSDRLLTKSNM